MKIFDWQVPLWNQLASDPSALPHAMLLAGPAGLGKLAFAQALAARLLCESPESASDGMACGRCSSCTWLASGNHPDFRLIRPDEDEGAEADESAAPVAESAPATATGKAAAAKATAASGRKSSKAAIRIAQIRELADFVFVGSHRHGKRVALIEPAEAMNPAAANALLKVLEEPPAGVYFILVSHSWRRLLPTIRSRCRMIAFGRPDPLLAEQWLASEGVKAARDMLLLAGGAPLLAAEWAQQGNFETYQKAIEVLADQSGDPVAMAAKWAALLKNEDSFAMPQLVEATQKWMFDLILLKFTNQLRYHNAWRDRLQTLVAGASAAGLLACYADLLRIRAVAKHPLNAQLFLEDMAARYLRTLQTARS